MNAAVNVPLLLLPLGWVWFGMGLAQNGWVAMGGYHISMAVFLWLGLRTRHEVKNAAESIAPRSRWRTWVPFLAVCIAVPLVLLWPLISIDDLVVGLLRQGIHPFWPFALYYPVVNPILEELYWRRFIDRRLHQKWVGDLFFGMYHALVLVHFTTLWFALACAVGLWGTAWAWRKVTERTGTLYVAYASHLAANVGIVVGVYIICWV